MYGYAHPIHVESADEIRFFAQAVWQLGGVREKGNRRQEIELIRLVGPISATSAQNAFQTGVDGANRSGGDADQRARGLNQVLDQTRPASQLLLADMLAQ